MQLHPEQHYGLKALDTNISPELANKAALTIEATAPWDDWKQRMGKAKDEEIHLCGRSGQSLDPLLEPLSKSARSNFDHGHLYEARPFYYR